MARPATSNAARVHKGIRLRRAHQRLVGQRATLGRYHGRAWCTSVVVAAAGVTVVDLDDELLGVPAEVPIRVL